MVAALSGIVAETRLGRVLDVAGARGDIELVYETADELAGAGSLAFVRRCQREAATLVETHWPAVDAVAAALAEASEPYMWADDLRRICRPYGVESTP